MQVLIIEDETPAANRLAKLLQDIGDDISIIHRLDSVESSVKFLQASTGEIDLIFMDIQLADGLSFDIFQQTTISTPVIFTTAFDQYTLKAFKVNSIDYLLKPIDEKELELAVEKYRKLYPEKDKGYPEKFMKMIREMNAARYKERLLIKRGQQLSYLKTTSVAYCFADGKLCYAVDLNGAKHLLECNLSQLEEQLQPTQFYRIRAAFYNFENLFDTINDPITNDEEWTPNGNMHWTSKTYQKKLDNLSRVLSEIGTGENANNSPTLIGACEIENRKVLEDLIKQPKLLARDYGVVHFDSPDKRGIDVALLYQKKHFKPTSYTNIPLLIYKDQEGKEDKKDKGEATDDVTEEDKSSRRIYTRDQLLVTGFLDGEEVNIIVNHWPSRSGGEKKSSPFREAAGALNRKIIDSLVKINPNAKIITMGDLNDGSYNKSVKQGI